MDQREIAQRRLFNQHLAGPPLPDPVAVVSHFGAMQAQEFAVAKWSIGQRTTGVADAAVQRAVDSGEILRTHALRPTWHFVAAADIRWIQALTGPRVHVFNGYYYRMHGIDDAYVARTNGIITGALRGANHLTRKDLGAVLAAAGMDATGNKLAYVVIRAELDGLVANGPMRGKQHTYALISERAPDAIVLAPDEALAELTRRYFTSHGPATIKDFAWWSSLTITQIKHGLRLLGSEVESVAVDGLTYWFAPGPAPMPEPSPTAHVLQPYDEYTVAYTESRPVANIAGVQLPVPNENSLVYAIIVDSQLLGLWRRTTERNEVTARIALAGPITAAQRNAVNAAFARYAAFIGTPVTVEWP